MVIATVIFYSNYWPTDECERVFTKVACISQFGFRLLALIWQFNFPPFMALIIAILNDGAIIITISKDRVRPSPQPERWNLKEIFIGGSILGGYLAMMILIFFWTAYRTDFFPCTFGVSNLNEKDVDDWRKLASAIYLQVSSISQAHLLVTPARIWSYIECPVLLLALAFFVAQLTAFTSKKNFGKEERELLWPKEQRNVHGLHPLDTNMFTVRSSYGELNRMAEEARRRAEISRLRELHTPKGHIASMIRLKGLDIDPIQQSYSV